jgi:hypothetical protein
VKPWDGGRNLHDLNSGFNQRHAGYLHLSAAQALAFVRERDNLPNGDLDRTHRQQAVLDYVLWDLGHQGALTDLGQLTNLLDVARRYMIASGGWNLLEFANEMHALTGKNLTLSTLPIVTTQNGVMVNGVAQDVDIVNLPYVSHLVQSAFSQPAQDTAKKPAARKKPAGPSSIPPPSTVTVDVYNGGTTNLLAAAVSQALVAAGYRAGATGSPAAQSQTVQAATQVFYGTGAAANAKKIAGYFGATATAASSVAAGHVEILLGTTSTAVPAGLGASSSSPASAPAASATSAANNGQAGGAVTVKANARYGIPCVY